MNDKEIAKLEDFVVNAEKTLAGVIDQAKFLALTEQEKKLRDEAVKILSRKLKKLNDSETVSDVKEVLKVKKIVRGQGRT